MLKCKFFFQRRKEWFFTIISYRWVHFAKSTRSYDFECSTFTRRVCYCFCCVKEAGSSSITDVVRGKDTVTTDEEDDEVHADDHPRKHGASVRHDAIVHHHVPVFTCQDLHKHTRTHTHQDHVWHHRSSINMQCLTFMFWILTTKLTVQSSVIRSTTSKQVKMRSVIFNLHHENRIRWDKVKTGGIRWNQVESSGIRIT